MKIVRTNWGYFTATQTLDIDDYLVDDVNDLLHKLTNYKEDLTLKELEAILSNNMDKELSERRIVDQDYDEYLSDFVNDVVYDMICEVSYESTDYDCQDSEDRVVN